MSQILVERVKYQVEDPTNPLNKYGESKLLGEKAVLNTSPQNIVLRIPVLYGEVENLKESTITNLLNIIQEGKPFGVSWPIIH